MSDFDDFRPTHVGWFWFCPIYLDMDHPGGPEVAARQEWMESLFTAAHAIEITRIRIMSFIWRDYEPTFWFVLTGEV